jgi:hypothetical protein
MLLTPVERHNAKNPDDLKKQKTKMVRAENCKRYAKI